MTQTHSRRDRRSKQLASLVAISTVLLTSACASSPIRPHPPRIPLAPDTVATDATNGGRVESIAVNPTDRNHALIAMEFGGLWKTHGGGSAWFRITGLPAVFVEDVEFGPDGKTVVAAVFRDNQTVNGGGIYVSRDGGDSWTRPSSGVVPSSKRTPARTSAHSVSHSADERGLWYVGTDYGVAISRDNGATWTHVSPEAANPGSTGVAIPTESDKQQDAAQSVLAMPGGTVLALTRTAVHRSDDRGATWRKVITDNFSQDAPSGGDPGRGGNKMDRSPFSPWAFIFKNYGGSGGSLYFYELDSETKTLLPSPQGRWRGPFVRVSKDQEFGNNHITVWIGAGWDGYYVTRDSAQSIRSIRADAQWNDWVSFIAPAGIHADLGDLGLDGDLQPAYLGSDGGIFKPHPTIAKRWVSAAVPGSGMNSFQIMDLAGTNFTDANGRTVPHLYFGTQDNKIWASSDGGATWPHSDSQEGYSLEVRHEARAGEKITVAYRAIGRYDDEIRFSDALLQNSRPVPKADGNGKQLAGLGLPYFLWQQASNTAKPSSWLRMQTSVTPDTGIYLSQNSGSNWVKVGTLNFAPAGEIKSTAGGAVAWVPVSLGGTPGAIGLVALTPSAGTVQTYDDSDVVRLPNGGTLNIRGTMWDFHAVYGVHPLDWKFLIAPDTSSNSVKVTRDGGVNWVTHLGLTQQVLRGGQLKLWDDSAFRMQVTDIAFDPYFDPRYGNRIFVGTRDAGIICSADGGQSWRTVKNSDQVKYITAFHFTPEGGVYVSAYGHGIWYIKPAAGCPESYKLPWDVRPPVIDPGIVKVGAVARAERPAAPRGVPDPRLPKLFVSASVASGGVTTIGDEGSLTVSGRSFPPGAEITLRITGMTSVAQEVRVGTNGQFSTTVRLPQNLPFGRYTIEAAATAAERGILTSTDFVKAYSDKR